MKLEIEQLILRIPNVSPEEGRQMSQRIVEQLADHLPGRLPNFNVNQMDVRIRVSDSISSDQMVRKITGAILNRISNMKSASTIPRSTNHFITSNEGRN